MSSSDIRDILQISQSTEPAPKRTKQPAEKRPDGISRELYSLIGGAPPVAFVKPTFKAKYQKRKKQCHGKCSHLSTQQEAMAFYSVIGSKRVKQIIKKNCMLLDYPFAKFNKVIDVLSYSDEDYEKYLTDTDWSKEETDYLFDLCRQYDLRFPVIEDRYNFGSKPRTIEDLKDRYYAVYRKMILQGKGPISGDYVSDRQSLAQQYAFDKAKEVERKNALIMLFNRTKEQVEEEEALFVEAKRIALNEARLSRERESLLNSLQLEQIQQMPSTPNTPLNASPASAVSGGNMGGVSGSHIIASSPGGIGITGGTAGGSSDLKKKKKITADVHDTKKEKLVPGVYVRSQKLPIVKPTMQPKVIKILEELGIGPRPIMPTSQICQRFEALQNSILNLLELKKVADKTETEHKVKIHKGRDTTPVGRKRSGSNAGVSNVNRDKRRK